MRGPPPATLASRVAPARQVALAALALGLAYGLVELALLGADLGLWGHRAWRARAYGLGAFWPSLFWGRAGQYPGQAGAMLVSYAFLHAGPMHLLGNLLALAALLRLMAGWLTLRTFLPVWLGAAAAGGLAAGLLATVNRPIVGASGALFGLVGLALGRDLRHRRARGASLWPSLGWLALVLAANLVFWAMQGGRLAWQTHLGGLVFGLIWGLWRPPPR